MDHVRGGRAARTVVVDVAVRDLLERFRPAGAPGPATPTGVPSDRTAELADELGPVLALLADTEDECDRIRRDAHVRATRLRADAAARATSTVAAARDRAEEARAEVVELQRSRSRSEAERELGRARQSVAALERTSRERAPALVEQVVDAVRSRLLAPEDAGDGARAEVRP